MSQGQGYTDKQLLRVAQNEVKKKVAHSSVMNEEADNKVPRFSLAELSVGKVLGRGTFSVVCDIENIAISKREVQSPPPEAARGNNRDDWHDDEHDGDNIFQDRMFMATNCRRDGRDCRYAIKFLQDSMRQDAEHFVRSLVDLAVEARFLAVVRHPNIIKLRAMASTSPFAEGKRFFVVFDKLYDILSTRLKTTWKKRMPGFFSFLCPKDKHAFWVERLEVLFDIANALNHLHDMNIIYRDVKPDNIGFDVRDDVKLFDFGLAKEVRPSRRADDGTYKLTGDVGSLRYMAPEVALDKPYNESCDVYSFSVLMWQILKVETPYELYGRRESFQSKVVRKGVRPRPDPKWPAALSELMKNGWHVNLDKRPSMDHVMSVLSDQISFEAGEDRSEVADHSKHSAALNVAADTSTEES